MLRQELAGYREYIAESALQVGAYTCGDRRPDPDASLTRRTGRVELLTGFGLATAAGLNAYIPLLMLGRCRGSPTW